MAEKVQINADKLKVLDAVMQKIEKDFGKGSIMRMNSTEVNDIPVIPTGSITLDMALGVGGYPKGRVVEIYGPESSGKTTLAIHAIAEAQKAGGIAAFIDAEHAFDSFYAQKLGVDVDNLLISQPDNGEQALEIADSLIRSSAIDIIVIDSVAALTPKAEIEGEMGDSKMGLQARLMSQALRKLTSSISKTKTVCIFINQLRDKIGVAKEGTHEPIIAITAMGLLTLVYLLFSVIQILYLFTNNMSLPDDMTYAEYARQGFFQLMFVSVLNVILVLICHAIFSKSTVLNIVLTIMSACTYVMIASSALRMTMYIKAYDLTYMRILVFAALAVLAVVLAGVIVRIYADRFPLVRYSMFVIVTVYIIVSFLRPAYLVARYNLENQDPKDVDFRYVTSLGADGAEEVYEFIVDNYMTGQDDDYYEYDNYQYDDYYNKYNNYKDIKGFSYDRMEWYFNSIRDTYKEKGAIRGFNFSRNKAEKYAKRFFKWYGKEE